MNTEATLNGEFTIRSESGAPYVPNALTLPTVLPMRKLDTDMLIHESGGQRCPKTDFAN